MKNVVLCLILSMSMFSCVTAKKLNKIELGMTKQEVIQNLGDPISVSSPGPNQEYLNYLFTETKLESYAGYKIPYFVLLEDGYVTQYGRVGEFSSGIIHYEEAIETSDGSNKNIHEPTYQTDMEKMRRDLIALKLLYDEGIITLKEFEAKRAEVLNRY